MRQKEIIPVFFTIDDGYAPCLGVALRSLIRNASRDYLYHIHIVYQELSSENKKRLEALEEDHVRILFTEMKDALMEITDRKENLLRCDYFTLTIYFRLFLADMFPEYDKGIYLDSDIVVPGDISKLYRTELGPEQILGGCTDLSIQNVPELVHYLEGSVGVNRMEYINSGVLLMNMKLMRREEFGKRFLEILSRWHVDCLAPDQDYINAMCSGRILYLDPVWDVMPQKDRDPEPDAELIHYNLFDKPWHYQGIQYEDYFWKYAKETEYYPELVQCRDNYGAEQKLQDQKSMSNMITKAVDLPGAEVTFKKLAEKGEAIRL